MTLFIKIIVFFALGMQSLSVWATACRVNGTGYIDINSAGSTDILVEPVPSLGAIYSYGDLQLECRFETSEVNSSFVDYIKTKPQALSLPGLGSFTGGLLVDGNQIPMPIPGDITIATLPAQNAGPWTKVNITPYIYPSNTPQSLNIAAGATIAILNLYQVNNYNGNRAEFQLVLKSKKNTTLWPNDCSINGGSPLDIDFGSVSDSDISSVPTNPGQSTKTVSINYRCSDTTVNQPIAIYLKAPTTASFNSNLIGTSNGDLGVAMIRNNNLVGVSSSYTSMMANGAGGDSLNFNLVRNSSGTLPATGPFTASAVLEIGLP